MEHEAELAVTPQPWTVPGLSGFCRAGDVRPGWWLVNMGATGPHDPGAFEVMATTPAVGELGISAVVLELWAVDWRPGLEPFTTILPADTLVVVSYRGEGPQ